MKSLIHLLTPRWRRRRRRWCHIVDYPPRTQRKSPPGFWRTRKTGKKWTKQNFPNTRKILVCANGFGGYQKCKMFIDKSQKGEDSKTMCIIFSKGIPRDYEYICKGGRLRNRDKIRSQIFRDHFGFLGHRLLAYIAATEERERKMHHNSTQFSFFHSLCNITLPPPKVCY